ncbi:MAG: Hsp20/alpha crystallin family protein [Synechococcus sp.]
MTITRWSPFREIDRWEFTKGIDSLRREMNHMFEQFMPAADRDLSEFGFVPPAEMEETEDSILLTLEVPGMEVEELDLEVTEDTVTVRGERKQEIKTEEEGRTHSELRYGKFERVITLPAHIKSEKVKAEYKHGMLKLTLPKSEVEHRRQVKIDVIES